MVTGKGFGISSGHAADDDVASQDVGCYEIPAQNQCSLIGIGGDDSFGSSV
jgi:hypothetical protein